MMDERDLDRAIDAAAGAMWRASRAAARLQRDGARARGHAPAPRRLVWIDGDCEPRAVRRDGDRVDDRAPARSLHRHRPRTSYRRSLPIVADAPVRVDQTMQHLRGAVIPCRSRERESQCRYVYRQTTCQPSIRLKPNPLLSAIELPPLEREVDVDRRRSKSSHSQSSR